MELDGCLNGRRVLPCVDVGIREVGLAFVILVALVVGGCGGEAVHIDVEGRLVFHLGESDTGSDDGEE